jgi:ubiquinone/menaquinone biosynthesis C-methylase UbiE
VGKEKQIVKEFYDAFGWDKTTDGVYEDTAVNVDMRPVLDLYRQKICMRVKSFLKSRGEYFLDVGSGGNPAYQYSSGYRTHVCVDLSKRGLVEARSKLKKRCVYVLADITSLPFQDNVFDATLAAHVLYHVPQNEQECAVRELQRTLKSGSSCIIIYSRSSSWFTSLLTKTPILFKKLFKKMAKHTLCIPDNAKHDEHAHPSLYFYAHDYSWFKKTFYDGWNLDIRCWSMVGNSFTKTFVPNNFFGRLIMMLILWIETVFPRTSVRICDYPMIIIHKK